MEELMYVREKLRDKKQLLDAWNLLVLPGANQRTPSRIVVKYFSKSNFSVIPERPSEAKLRQTLEDMKVPAAAIDLAVLEESNALVLNEASSKERAKILALEGAGYFP